MLVIFRCKPVPDVIMVGDKAKPILDLLHKDIGRGVITALEAGNALATLEGVVQESQRHTAASEVVRDVGQHGGGVDDAPEHAQADNVSFATRAFPLMEMLRAAHKGGHDILWGV